MDRHEREIHERLSKGESTPSDIAEIVYWAGTVGPTTSLKDFARIQKEYAKKSQPSWMDVLIELYRNTPREQEHYQGCVIEFLGLVLHFHPSQIYKVAPLLREPEHLSDAILILSYSERPEALLLLETLFQQAPNLDEQDALDLVDSVQCIHGDEAALALEKLRIILSERIADSPRIKEVFDWADSRRHRTNS